MTAPFRPDRHPGMGESPRPVRQGASIRRPRRLSRCFRLMNGDDRPIRVLWGGDVVWHGGRRARIISMVKLPILTSILVAALVAIGVVHGLGHTHEAHEHKHEHHVHVHSHDGYVHTHEHSHPANEEHPAHDSPGDHHECGNGPSEPVPVLPTASSRDGRRPIESDFVSIQADVSRVHGADAGGIAPPERPPRTPTRQDSISQIRTVVLLT